ncbi:MAG: DNA/RNA-binding winged helix domain-containing protein [Anaerolineae bacterium]
MTLELDAYHRAQPLRLGMQREELRSRAGLKAITFAALLDMQDQIAADGNLLRLADHAVGSTRGRWRRSTSYRRKSPSRRTRRRRSAKPRRSWARTCYTH